MKLKNFMEAISTQTRVIIYPTDKLGVSYYHARTESYELNLIIEGTSDELFSAMLETRKKIIDKYKDSEVVSVKVEDNILKIFVN